MAAPLTSLPLYLSGLSPLPSLSFYSFPLLLLHLWHFPNATFKGFFLSSSQNAFLKEILCCDGLLRCCYSNVYVCNPGLIDPTQKVTPLMPDLYLRAERATGDTEPHFSFNIWLKQGTEARKAARKRVIETKRESVRALLDCIWQKKNKQKKKLRLLWMEAHGCVPLR